MNSREFATAAGVSLRTAQRKLRAMGLRPLPNGRFFLPPSVPDGRPCKVPAGSVGLEPDQAETRPLLGDGLPTLTQDPNAP